MLSSQPQADATGKLQDAAGTGETKKAASGITQQMADDPQPLLGSRCN